MCALQSMTETFHKLQGKAGGSVPIKFCGIPTLTQLQPFAGMASALLSRTVFSLAAFTLITGAATARGTVAAASHQICLQLFWFLSFFPEPLSVAAQSLIAQGRASRQRSVTLARCILGLAAGLGVTIAGACSTAFLFGSSLFTSSASVAQGMSAVAPAAAGALVLCALAMACDGISIGSDDYAHLPMVNLLGLLATLAYLQWCNAAALGLPQVWLGMVVVFAVRFGVHAVHHLGSHRSTSLIAAALGWSRPRRARIAGLLPAPSDVQLVAAVPAAA